MNLEARTAEKREQRRRALAILSKGLPYSQIHKPTGISVGTLSNMKNGRSFVDTRAGRPTVIPREVEEIMAKKLERLVEAHMAVDLTMFPLIAKDIARKLKLPTALWLREARAEATVQGGLRAPDRVQRCHVLREGVQGVGGDRAQEGHVHPLYWL
jgi:hypothetical protein